MERDSSLLMVGYVFEYWAKGKAVQHIGNIADQLLEYGLVADVDERKKTVTRATVRRTTDSKHTIPRYTARIVEWSRVDSRYLDNRPVHVYVGKIVSEVHGIVNLTKLEEALNEVKEDFPHAQVLHCTESYI